jgi:hypothetical protein
MIPGGQWTLNFLLNTSLVSELIGPRLTVATRNTADITRTGAPVFSPWEK